MIVEHVNIKFYSILLVMLYTHVIEWNNINFKIFTRRMISEKKDV